MQACHLDLTSGLSSSSDPFTGPFSFSNFTQQQIHSLRDLNSPLSLSPTHFLKPTKTTYLQSQGEEDSFPLPQSAQLLNHNFLPILENLPGSEEDVPLSKFSLQTTGFEDYASQEEAFSSASAFFNHQEYPLNSEAEELFQEIFRFEETANEGCLIEAQKAKS